MNCSPENLILLLLQKPVGTEKRRLWKQIAEEAVFVTPLKKGTIFGNIIII